MKKLFPIILTTSTVLFSTISFAAGNEIKITHKGKVVKSIPVDKLGELEFSVSSSTPFKQFYSGQWGTLDNALIVVSSFFKKGSAVPNLKETYSNSVTELANTYSDSAWGSKKSFSKSFYNIAKNNGFYSADTDYNIAIGVRFSRKEYTGKTVWKNGGWVQETRWVDLGPVFATTVLSLENPTFAKEVNINSLLEDAQNTINSNNSDPNTFNNAVAFSKDIYNGNNSDSYEGSKVLSVTKQGEPKYSWNYYNEDQMVYIKMPVEMNIKAIKKSGAFIGTEQEFKCTKVFLSGSKNLTKNAFDKSILEIGADFRDYCTTKEGKKGKDFGNVLPTNTDGKQTTPEDLIKGFLKELK
ncbi:MAG: hypothetical protein U0457_11655 [Candidatus Sericytochromatia bacterium]